MAVMKGSKQEKLKLVAYDPAARIRRAVITLLFLASVVAVSFYGGVYASVQQLQALSAQHDHLQDALAGAENQISKLTQRVSVLEKGGEVDRQAAEGIRQTVKSLKGQVASLEEEVSFYKGIMAPGSKDKGLRVSKVDIQPLDQLRSYRYSIMMTQVEDNKSHIQGLAAVNFIGTQNGKKTIIPLREIDDQVSELGVKFRFRYFQEVTGQVRLPDTFEIEQVQVVLQSTGNKAQRVEETIQWPHS